MGVETITGVPAVPARDTDGHKGTYGRVLVVAGSRGMSGAAVLAGRAALRGGAGLVEVACPRLIQPIVASAEPCFMTHGLECDPEGLPAAPCEDDLLERAGLADVLAIGPGLGRSEDVRWLVRTLIENARSPIVLDADGLNNLSPMREAALAEKRPPLVLTPHPGEFARMAGRPVPEVLADRERLAAEFAADYEVILVLKGHHTLVTDGDRLYRNMTGNPGMATGGSGDVLTGLIAALIGQGMEPFDAARLGCHLHGLAGDMAAAELGQHSLIASDLLDFLPHAFRQGLS